MRTRNLLRSIMSCIEAVILSLLYVILAVLWLVAVPVSILRIIILRNIGIKEWLLPQQLSLATTKFLKSQIP